MSTGIKSPDPRDPSSHLASNSSSLVTEKTLSIRKACQERDVAALVQCAATPSGFVNDHCRRLAWPVLLGCDDQSLLGPENIDPSPEKRNLSSGWEDLPVHPDERQVDLDVERSFVYYPTDDGAQRRAARKEELGSLITQVLRQYPFLCYFQGYHDIVQVILLVLGRQMAAGAIARLSVLRIRDFMLPSLAAATTHLTILPCILRTVEPHLERRLSQTHPFFALSALLTLYAHEIEEYADIARLFDFFLAFPASIPIYSFATVVIGRKKELLNVEEDEPEMLHAILSKLPNPLDLDQLIAQTIDLYTMHPPSSLPGNPWRDVDKYSVLKTAADTSQIRVQTLAQGESWFHQQESKLKRQQFVHDAKKTLKAYRRPAQSVGFALMIALLAWWLRRDPRAANLALLAARKLQSMCGF